MPNKNEMIPYLYSLASRGSKPGLSRIKAVLAELGNPQESLRVINVTGTNGKGSYCKMLGDILSLSSYRTGVFSSPHLVRINESITVDGEIISDDDLSDVLSRCQDICEKHTLTQFEVLTVACILYFKEQKTDIALMEVGMGGELDATNVFSENIMSVILGVSLDHTSYLGSSVEMIAREKSGIMKKGCPVFTASEDEKVLEVINSRAKELDCPIFRNQRGAKIISSTPEKTVFSFKGTEYTLKSGAMYQVLNAEKVLSSVDILPTLGYSIKEDAIAGAFESLERPARFEVFARSPYVIFDGGHNPECTAALKNDILRHFGDEKLTVIIGIMADKDMAGICSHMGSIAKEVFTVTPKNPRALDDSILANEFSKNGIKATPCGNFKTALSMWDKKTPLLCVGSLYSYEEFKKEFKSLG